MKTELLAALDELDTNLARAELDAENIRTLVNSMPDDVVEPPPVDPPIDPPPVDPPVQPVGPTPEPNPPDATPLLYDGTGGLERDALYGTWTQPESGASAGIWLPWAKPDTVGDWRDLEGVFEGPKAFATVKVTAGQTGEVRLAVPAALSDPGKPVQIVLRAVDNVLAVFRSREGGAAPTLSGLACVCDVECNSTTYQMLGTAPTITVSTTQVAYLRFDHGSSGELVLQISKVWQTGTVGLYAFAPPIEADDGSRKWLHRDSGGLIYYSDDMSPTGDPVGDCVAAQFDQTSDPSYPGRKRIVRADGQKAIEITTNPTLASALYVHVPIWPEAKRAAAQYTVCFGADFPAALKDSGKMPGFNTATRTDDPSYLLPFGFPRGTMGTPYVGSGTQSTGKNGYWPRGGYLRPRPAPHPLADRVPLDNYVYYAGRPPGADYGEGWPWSKFGRGTLALERPYVVYHEVMVNDYGQANGTMETRIDGELAMRREGILWRTDPPWENGTERSTDLLLRSFGMMLYHGGKSSWAAAGTVQFWGMAVQRLE